MNPNTASYNSLSILIFLVIVFILLFLVILRYFIFSWSSCLDNIYWDVWLRNSHRFIFRYQVACSIRTGEWTQKWHLHQNCFLFWKWERGNVEKNKHDLCRSLKHLNVKDTFTILPQNNSQVPVWTSKHFFSFMCS